MMCSDIVIVYSPFPTLAAARDAATTLLNEGLAACCNILPPGESHYLWQGEAVVAQECILIAKTLPAKGQHARDRLTSIHPYSCPTILSFTAQSGDAFAAWAMAALAPPGAPIEGD